MNEKISKIIPWMKAHKIITGILFFILLIIIIPSSPKKDTPAQVTGQKVIFDVPSLIDKNIDEIVGILGAPKNNDTPKAGQLLGNKEWDMTFEKEGFQLLVTYNYDTKVVKDFFVGGNDETYENKDTKRMMQITNTKDNSSQYEISFVKANTDPSRFTGILIQSKKIAEVKRERETISVVYAEKIIKNTLKAPSTAKFVDVKAYELSDQSDVWAVNGYVDSQNGFGAMLRSQWEVQLDFRDGKGGTVKSVFFDGKKVL